MNPQESQSPYGNSGAWAQIISGAGQGIGSAMQGNASAATTKQEAREARRRTMANLLNSALRRNQNMFRMNRENAGDMNDFQSQAIQQIARGFTDALSGSTGY